VRILGISGSLRRRSTNTALLLAAKALAPDSVAVDLFDGIGELPYFNPDLDGETPPPPVGAFRRAVAESDALLISTPEYAHGIPGVLKNALDWLVSDPDFVGKRVGVVSGSASEGGFAQRALLEVLRTMSAKIVPEAVITIAAVRSKLDPEGSLADDGAAAELKRAVAALAQPAK
jgi:NAD(P)H-dependent FMN reductase